MNASASLSAAAVGGVAPIGRELAQSPPLMGLMAGKLGPDGNSAAFDMKSLGKHIEAVRCFTLPAFFSCNTHWLLLFSASF